MNKHESLLRLTRPKLLSQAVFNKSTPVILDLKDRMAQHYFDGKSDKRNKSDYKVVDFLESKKNKSRQKNKKRTRGSLYTTEDLSGIRDELDTNVTDEINFVRNSKHVKSKKDDKDENIQPANEFFRSDEITNEVSLNNLLTVEELAEKLNVSSADIIKWLFLKGISVTINQLLDISISTLVAKHYSFNILKQDTDGDTDASNVSCNNSGRARAPIITLLGHVDHGKTTLLKAIKQDGSLIQEAGNITQSIGSYEILIDGDPIVKKLIFLDTPGHEAFVGMRKRGTSITDLAVLVISADDGLQPQTIEAIHHIQSRKLPFVVAINKIDKLTADTDKVKKQLSGFNIVDRNINGGHTVIGVSALSCKNIDQLLSSIITLSKSQNLKSDPLATAEGIILEAHLNKQKGPVAQLLIRNGTLRVGDIVLAGNFYGKVKAINNSTNQNLKSVESVSLADILCFTEVPTPGLSFKVVSSEKIAKALASSQVTEANSTILNSRISLNDAGQNHAKKMIKQINLIIKTCTQGAIDAIAYNLSCLPQEKVQINLLLVASGEVSSKDIELAATSNSLILVFGLNVSSGILDSSKKRGVSVHVFNVIYDLIGHVQDCMLSFVDLNYEKQILGDAEVKNLFVVNKRTVAGCLIKNGKLKKGSHFQIKRAGQNIYTGLIDSLKRLKDDADEVTEANECGVMCKDYNLWNVGDFIECYELRPLEKTLS